MGHPSRGKFDVARLGSGYEEESLNSSLQIAKSRQIVSLVQRQHASCHQIVGCNRWLGIVGKEYLEFARLRRTLEAADMPRNLSGIQSQLFGDDRCFRVPLLNVEGQIHQHGAVALHCLETLQSTDQRPDLRGIQV